MSNQQESKKCSMFAVKKQNLGVGVSTDTGLYIRNMFKGRGFHMCITDSLGLTDPFAGVT